MNTNPGLSPASIFPQQAGVAGVAMSDLFDNEIQLALNRKVLFKK
jgi:D-alanine-D-alanine ligase